MKTLFTALFLTLLLFTCSFGADPLGDAARSSGKPLVADFGLNICKQCIKQSAVMETYKNGVGSSVDTRFVHVSKEAPTAEAYKVILIPTLIFFDAKGKEVFRNVGFMGLSEMMAKSRELGFLP